MPPACCLEGLFVSPVDPVIAPLVPFPSEAIPVRETVKEFVCKLQNSALFISLSALIFYYYNLLFLVLCVHLKYVPLIFPPEC